MSFFNELKRRNVFRVGIAYLVGAWLLIQISDIVIDNIGAPPIVLQVIFLALGIGFFISLFVAWAFELTPEGVKREKDVDRSQSITPQTGKKLNNTILVLMALAIAYLLFDKFSGTRPEAVSTPAVAVSGDSMQLEVASAPSAAPLISRQSIAVLPFDNRSRNVDDEYFTEGIHDDLLTNLARIASLKVISRTSVNQYKDTEKTIPQIAEELGVATVMEGAVQRSGDTVRINVQLIDAVTDEHLWAEIFDRELTAENLFAIQSEISQKIANALEATLSPEETQRLNDFPTQSMEAYNAYLRGRQLLPQRNAEDLGKAMESFELAVNLDPEFALAWVGIAESAALLEAHGTLNPDTQLQIMQMAVDRALQIDPNLGEAYVSQGSLFDDLGKREQAEAAYKRAIELSPNYATAYHWYSILIGDTNDRLQDSLALLNKATQLDPLSTILKQNIAGIYSRMGRYDEAEAAYKQLLAANPEFSSGMVSMGWDLYGSDRGKLDEAILITREAHRIDPGKISSLVTEYTYWIGLGDYQQAQLVYLQMETLDAGHRWLPIAKGYSNIRQGRYAAAKEEGLFLVQNFTSLAPQGHAFNILARSGAYEQAREVLSKIEPRYFDPEQWPDILNEGAGRPCIAGLTLIKTGDEQLGRDLLTFSANYWQQTAPLYIQHADSWPTFECLAYLGEVEKSLDALEISLEHGHVLRNWLGIAANPELRMIQEHPRFAAMDEKARAELNRQREHLAQLEAEAST
jgi:TolB-like protein/Tfp pilus assembly protein PilF